MIMDGIFEGFNPGERIQLYDRHLQAIEVLSAFLFASPANHHDFQPLLVVIFSQKPNAS